MTVGLMGLPAGGFTVLFALMSGHFILVAYAFVCTKLMAYEIFRKVSTAKV